MNAIDSDRKIEIETLHDFLNKHPMYQRQLACLLGVTTSAVEKWSSGDRRLTQRTLNDLNRLHYFLNQNPKIRESYIKTRQCAVC
jgi:transcriptional regulator with XRE-family HTH domain